MAENFAWKCPYCNATATITASNVSVDSHDFNNNCKHGSLSIATEVIVCPNPNCKEYDIQAYLWTRKVKLGYLANDVMLMQWHLRPRSNAKPFPSYIPKPILQDYEEACLIMNDSPKASATLSRRCLQGMIRDFFGISKGRLIDEISELKETIDPTTWAAIDAVRNVGNIGAHMEQDINVIVDVDPDEAKLLIGLIEFLMQDWYIGRYERAEHMKRVIALGQEKTAAKKALPPTT